MIYIIKRTIVTEETYAVQADNEPHALSAMKYTDAPVEVNTTSKDTVISHAMNEDEYLGWMRPRCPEYWTRQMIEETLIK